MKKKKEFETFVINNIYEKSNNFLSKLKKEFSDLPNVLDLYGEIEEDTNIDNFIIGIYEMLQNIHYDKDFLICRNIREKSFKNIKLNDIGFSWTSDLDKIDYHIADGQKKLPDDSPAFIFCGKVNLEQINIPETFASNIFNNFTESEINLKYGVCFDVQKLGVLEKYSDYDFNSNNKLIYDIDLPFEVCTRKNLKEPKEGLFNYINKK